MLSSVEYNSRRRINNNISTVVVGLCLCVALTVHFLRGGCELIFPVTSSFLLPHCVG